MRYTKFNLFQVSGFILGFFSLIGCGSYQNSAYYSDGIYGSRDVVVVRRQVEQPVATNSYSQYFDEKAKEYQWDEQEGNVALTQIDSLNQQNENNFQSKPQWGGGNNTTQIVFVDNGPNFGFGGFGGFGFGGFYDPYPAYWNWPYRYNNPFYFNRFGGGFYNPYYLPYGGFYGGYGSLYDPYFGGYGYFYRHPYHRNYNRINRFAHNNRERNRTYSSTYRGRPSSQTRVSRSTTAPTQASQATASRSSRSRSIALNNSNQARGVKQGNTSVPNLVQTGRRATQARRSSQVGTNNQNNSAYIDRVIRTYKSRGYNVDVIQNPTQARRAVSRQNNQSYTNGATQSRYNTSAQSKPSASSKRSNGSNNSYKASNNSSNRSSYSRSSSSRSSSSVRSSSSRSSSGRSSSGRSSGRRQ